MGTFNFYCKDDKTKFTINKPEIQHTNELKNVFCPSCGKKWGTPESKIELDVSNVTSFAQERGALAKENAEASAHAEEAARRDRAYLDRENPMVMPGVRKNVIDTINDRAKDFI